MIHRQNPQYIIVPREELDNLLKEYWDNIYVQFIGECMEPVYNVSTGEPDPTVYSTLSEIYSKFKIWFRATVPGVRVPERSIVRGELVSRWGYMYGNGWPGIRLITNDTTNIS
jgi:hypothetical protein